MKQFFQKLFRKKEQQSQSGMEKQCCTAQEKPTVDDFDVDPETFHDLLQKRPQIKLIDVRKQEEYDEGYISGAELLPVQELSQERIDALDVKKEDEILLYCRSGGRSGHAVQHFKQLGYTNVKHLDGGILAWEEKKLPIKKP
ncbi:MAG: rhodanese-like domain-containing protein [Nanoarchaeota archaeon]